VLDLNETVTGMLKMLKRLIARTSNLSGIPARICGWLNRPVSVDQILANLLVNAKDAIADGGKLLSKRQNRTFDEQYYANNAGLKPGEYVMLAISDNGCGMHKDLLNKIFEPFLLQKSRARHRSGACYRLWYSQQK